MDDASKTESLHDLVKNVDSGNIKLPEFQRDFVWEIGRSYDLFDSLVKEIFIGALIYGIPSFEIVVRELDKRPRKERGTRRAKLSTHLLNKDEIEKKVKINNFRLLLDGQQRITSIYRALKGIDEIWFVINNESEMKDESKKKEFLNRTLEELLYELNGYEDEERLSIKLSDVYKIVEGSGSLFEDDIKNKFFNELVFINLKDEDTKKEVFKKYLIVCGKLADLLKAQKMISYYLLNMGTEKFALFFERSNSRGIQLNFIDILTAKLYMGFNLRNKIEEFESDNPGYEFNKEIIVRAIAYIASNGKNVDKSYILSELDSTHFSKYWKETSELYKKSIDFLFGNHFIISQSWMPYDNMLIPLIIFLRTIPTKDFSGINESQKNFIEYWYWSSIFSQRYTGSSNEAIRIDSDNLKKIANGTKISDKSFFNKLEKLQVTTINDVKIFSTKSNSIYKGILNLINYESKGLIDWKNTTKLSLNSRIEDHHIFPREYLKDKFKHLEIEQIDCVANRTLIPKITNIRIGKSTPSKYLKELEKSNPNLSDSLKNHLIPIDLINGSYDNNYLDFIDERAGKISNLINDYVVSKQGKIKTIHEHSMEINTNCLIQL